MGLNDIVKINITTQSAQVKQPGFGTILIADAHSRFVERLRYYTDTDSMLADGFLTTDAAYIAAQQIMAQNPQVTRFAVGRRALKPTLNIEITPIAQNLRVYTVSINGVDFSYTSDGTATVAEITAGLVAAIGAVTGFTVTDATTKITIIGTVAGNWLRLKANDPSLLKVAQVQADPGIATDLAAIALEQPDWYGVFMTTASKAEVLAMAAWVEANSRESVQASQDSDVITTVLSGATDVAASVKSAGYARTGIAYHPDNGRFFDAAWLGKVFPKNPGSSTFKFKSLAGVETVALTATQEQNAKDKNCNVYTNIAGIGITAEGKSGSGEFLDVVRDRDWFSARLQTRIFTVLANADKVPFTDPGLASLEAEVRAQNAEGVSSGFLAADPAPTVIVKPVSQNASADKAIRKLSPNMITFHGVIAGAIHNLQLDGVISVS